VRFESERLIVRPWKVEDIGDLVEGLNNYEVAKYITTKFPYTVEDAKEFISTGLSPSGAVSFAVELKESGKVIGGTSIRIDGDVVTAGGIWVNTRYQGSGYGEEIWRERARYCFDVLGVSEIQSGFLEDNEKSWKMQEKVGFKKTGERKKRFVQSRGCNVMEIKVSLKREDFYA